MNPFEFIKPLGKRLKKKVVITNGYPINKQKKLVKRMVTKNKREIISILNWDILIIFAMFNEI